MLSESDARPHMPTIGQLLAGLGWVALGWVVWDWRRW